MSRDRTMRRAQAIHPYGPGAILDWGQECFIVLDTDTRGWRRAPKIRLQRLERMLGANGGFRVPPALHGRWNKSAERLDVQRFPSWLFCPRCRMMWRWGRQQEENNRDPLPRCLANGCSSILVPMRYVAACPEGHISDVDWWWWAHARRSGAAGPCDRRDQKLKFIAKSDRGSSLEALEVRCEICGAGRNLRDILDPSVMQRLGQKCSGRQPWQSREVAIDCDHRLEVLQRSQTAVHFSEVISALDIRTADDDQECIDPVEDALDSLSDFDAIVKTFSAVNNEDAFVGVVIELSKRATEYSGIDIRPDDVFRILRLRAGVEPPDSPKPVRGRGDLSERDLLDEEWAVLTQPTSRKGPKQNIIVSREAWPRDAGVDSVLGRLIDGVFLVERLREVRALRGFRRVRTDGTLVPPDLGRGQDWLPAVEVFGEGLFLRFSNDAMQSWETDNMRVLRERLAGVRDRLADPSSPSQRFGLDPDLAARFVAIHTFAHIFMRQLCFECGYSGASIRERLYVFEERVGVLIYTADGDSEGSLGGLVRQGRADRIGQTVLAALERSAWCSNDPICSELPEHGFDKLNRAACHACALAAETSCTHLNALLDRALISGDGRNCVRGFFRDVIDDLASGEGSR